MTELNLLARLGQVSSVEAGDVFRDHLRGCVRQLISEVMASEVNELCGTKHSPDNKTMFRAGSSPGRVLHEANRVEVTRPRVRKRLDDGSSCEVQLATYQAACDPSHLQESIVNALVSGVSSRDVSQVLPESPGVNASSVGGLACRLTKQTIH